MILQRISYWCTRSHAVRHEWYPSAGAAKARADEIESTDGNANPDVADIDVPFDDIADLIHFLNTTDNHPTPKGHIVHPKPPIHSAPHNWGVTATSELAEGSVPIIVSSLERVEIVGTYPGTDEVLPLEEWAVRAEADRRAAPPSALDTQVGGDHYKKLGIYQPWEVVNRWLTKEEFHGYMKGTAIAYLAREKDKGGNQDIEKAVHTLQGLLEFESKEAK